MISHLLTFVNCILDECFMHLTHLFINCDFSTSALHIIASVVIRRNQEKFIYPNENKIIYTEILIIWIFKSVKKETIYKLQIIHWAVQNFKNLFVEHIFFSLSHGPPIFLTAVFLSDPFLHFIMNPWCCRCHSSHPQVAHRQEGITEGDIEPSSTTALRHLPNHHS